MKQCPRCEVSKPLNLFYRDKTRPDGRAALCKECNDKKTEKWREKNREKYNADMRAYYARFRTRQQSASMKKRLGITLEEKQRILDSQGGVCAICLKPNKQSVRPFAMDHDHKTGKIRGVLCYKCNSLLHLVENETLFAKAIEYIEKHSAV